MQLTANKWSQRFQNASSALSVYQLDRLAEQAAELAVKADSGNLYTAFCGHFSAGKSTLVNALLGADVLPASPIPTTANVVEVRTGNPQALVTMASGEQIQFPLEDHLESVKRYCVEEANVKRVSIDYPSAFLPPKVVLLDTPGIDSTDAVHQVATESVLFLSDLVFYMMDYNHVQSELNFLFAKELQNRGKKFYLVVNQIDKHMDFELDFDSYQQSVEDAFAGWNVTPQAIFYTSMQEPNHPNNQFEELKTTLQTLFGQKTA
ncbi:MAG: hypothetical protein JWN30_1473, partial [Bacilli bacterium]|nr:hypothetical protein [Bacilli bacterium]